MDNSELPFLPPIPAAHQSGPEVCAVVRLYLAVIDDLPEQQIALLNAHLVTCAACMDAYRALERATQLVRNAVATAPSMRVDAAIQALIAGREQRQQSQPLAVLRPTFTPMPALSGRRNAPRR